MRQADQALRQPPAEIIHAPERITPGRRAPDEQPLAADGKCDGEDVDADIDTKQRDDFRDDARIGAGQQHVGDEHAQPLRRHQRDDERQHGRLGEPAQEAAQEGRRREGEIAGFGNMREFGVEHVGHRAQRARRIDVLQGDAGQSVMLAHQRDEPRGQQRVTAEVGEEIRVEGNRLRRQHGFCRLQQDRFRRCAGLFLLLARAFARQFDALQLVAVDLARRQAWQFCNVLVARRHHIGGQALAQQRAQIARIERDLCGLVGDDEGDELVDTIVMAQHDRDLREPRNFCKLRLDLAQFDAKAADLDLVVDAATEGDLAIGFHHHRVAGAIEDRIGPIAGEGIGNEFFRRQRRAVEIALGDAGAADQQFALDAAADQIERIIGHIAGVVRDRPADRHRLAGAHERDGGHDGGFGGTVAVEDRTARPAPAHRDGRRTGFAAQNDDAQRGDIARQHGEQRRHSVEHGDARRIHDLGQAIGLAHDLGRGDEESGADEIGHPDFFHRQVEGNRGTLEDDVAGKKPIDLVGRTQVMANVLGGDDDALGHACRPRCIDHVGGHVGPRTQRPRINVACVRQVDQLGRADHGAWHVERGVARVMGFRQQQARAGVLQADSDPLTRRVGIKGQPGRTGLGDGDLRREKIAATLHPEPDDIAGTNAAAHEATRNGGGCGIDLCIGDMAAVDDVAGRAGMGRNTCGKNFGQHFVAHEIGTLQATQHGGCLRVMIGRGETVLAGGKVPGGEKV